MASYVISDIHGELDLFEELLDRIALKDSDTLYILGDVVDRGPHPVKVLQSLMSMPNAVCLAGNHELMALECLDYLCTEITEQSAAAFDARMIRNLAGWQMNGSGSTLKEFRELSPEDRREVTEYMRDFLIYEELKAGEGYTDGMDTHRPWIDGVTFKCPKCGEYEIGRCDQCRDQGVSYECKKCGFIGP